MPRCIFRILQAVELLIVGFRRADNVEVADTHARILVNPYDEFVVRAEIFGHGFRAIGVGYPDQAEPVACRSIEDERGDADGDVAFTGCADLDEWIASRGFHSVSAPHARRHEQADAGSVQAEVSLLRRRVEALHARVHEIGLASAGHLLVHVARIRAGKLGLRVGNLVVGDDIGRLIRAAMRGSGAVVVRIVAKQKFVLIGHDLRFPEKRGVIGKAMHGCWTVK